MRGLRLDPQLGPAVLALAVGCAPSRMDAGVFSAPQPLGELAPKVRHDLGKSCAYSIGHEACVLILLWFQLFAAHRLLCMLTAHYVDLRLQWGL